MARFHVVAFDPNDNTTCSYIGRHISATEAVLRLPWFEQIYKDTWVMDHIFAQDIETVISNCWQRMSWVVVCVNLDEEILRDLNGGASSVSSQMQQN